MRRLQDIYHLAGGPQGKVDNQHRWSRNVTAQPIVEPEDIRRLLVEQVTGVVRWRESVKWLADQGVTQLVEAGAGKVLTGMAKRIDDRLQGVSISSAATLMAFVEAEIEAQA